MFVNVDKLHGKIRELRLSVADVAEKMGIDRSTLYRKLGNNGAGLTVKDAQMLVEILHLTEQEAVEIFFAREVA
jgi:transcriptional regulator with XRE-family HTH domain